MPHLNTIGVRGVSPAFLLGGLLLLSASCYAENVVGQAKQSELVRLVRNDCGSCHGLKLTGGLGPSLMPDALKEKPIESLRETILRGRTGTAMPPWSNFLSEAEAAWIVERLKEGFPNAH